MDREPALARIRASDSGSSILLHIDVLVCAAGHQHLWHIMLDVVKPSCQVVCRLGHRCNAEVKVLGWEAVWREKQEI